MPCPDMAWGLVDVLDCRQLCPNDVLGRRDDSLQSALVLPGAAGVAHCDAVLQDTLHCVLVKVRQKVLQQSGFPQLSQEVETLLYLPDNGGGVYSPGEVLSDVHPQDFKTVNDVNEQCTANTAPCHCPPQSL